MVRLIIILKRIRLWHIFMHFEKPVGENYTVMDNNSKQNQTSNWQTIAMLVVAVADDPDRGLDELHCQHEQRRELSYPNEFVNMVENKQSRSPSALEHHYW